MSAIMNEAKELMKLWGGFRGLKGIVDRKQLQSV